jgi:hypothetical protein
MLIKSIGTRSEKTGFSSFFNMALEGESLIRGVRQVAVATMNSKLVLRLTELIGVSLNSCVRSYLCEEEKWLTLHKGKTVINVCERLA